MEVLRWETPPSSEEGPAGAPGGCWGCFLGFSGLGMFGGIEGLNPKVLWV